jgi:3-(3-hydroxy-phenyl)propionate hydroxylase
MIDDRWGVSADGQPVRAKYLAGCDGGRSLIRKAAGIGFPGWDPKTSCLIADVQMAEEPEWGFGRDAVGLHLLHRLGDRGPVRVMVTEQHVGQSSQLTLRDVSKALIAHSGRTTGCTMPPGFPGLLT